MKELAGKSNGKKFKFDDKDLGNLRKLTNESRVIIASLQDILNQRLTDIGKHMFRLQIEENYCLKFKNIMVSYLEKQENDEMILTNQIREKKMKKYKKSKNIPDQPMKDVMVYNEQKEE